MVWTKIKGALFEPTEGGVKSGELVISGVTTNTPNTKITTTATPVNTAAPVAGNVELNMVELEEVLLAEPPAVVNVFNTYERLKKIIPDDQQCWNAVVASLQLNHSDIDVLIGQVNEKITKVSKVGDEKRQRSTEIRNREVARIKKDQDAIKESEKVARERIAALQVEVDALVSSYNMMGTNLQTVEKQYHDEQTRIDDICGTDIEVSQGVISTLTKLKSVAPIA